MMRKLIFLFLISFSTLVFAKEKYIIPKITAVYGYSEDSHSSLLGGGGGAVLGYNLRKDNWSFEMDVSYLYLKVDDKNSTIFKELPALIGFKYEIISNISVFFSGGICYTAIFTEEEKGTPDYMRYKFSTGIEADINDFIIRFSVSDTFSNLMKERLQSYTLSLDIGWRFEFVTNEFDSGFSL